MSSSAAQGRPPYPARYAGLGGTPHVIPDVPVAAVLLALYLVFGVIHLRIFVNNKNRGHKFMFNGAMLGLCKIRVITMSMRIAWTCYPTSAGLGIAAGVFVYVGIIIPYIVNWWFVQRIVRAQHPKFGWSTAYRIIHRGGFAGLIAVLILLIVASISPFFTLNTEKLRIFRILIKTGQTYFTVFCLAPAILVVLSLIFPRHEVEKFGAGRLRVKIAILLAAVAVLSVGQIFRCVLAWIPPTPLRNGQGQPVETPWHLKKTCFYVFNFATELIVIIMYALARIDLRFHVPNGCRKAGDYTEGKNQYPESRNESEKAILEPPVFMTQQNNSSDTLYKYKSSFFEDTHILADSLRFASSTLEIDEKTGTCKIKRASGDSTKSATSLNSAGATSLHDRSMVLNSAVPPIPEDSAQWPLPASGSLRCVTTFADQSTPSSRNGTPHWLFDLENSLPDDSSSGDEIGDTITPVKRNSRQHKRTSSTPSSPQNSAARIELYRPISGLNDKRKSSTSVKRTTSWQNSALHVPQRRSDTEDSSSGRSTPTLFDLPRLPETDIPAMPEAHKSRPARRSSGSLKIIALGGGPRVPPHHVLDVSLLGEQARTITPSENGKDRPLTAEAVTQDGSLRHSAATSNSDGREYATAQNEISRFSFESDIIPPMHEMALKKAKR